MSSKQRHEVNEETFKDDCMKVLKSKKTTRNITEMSNKVYEVNEVLEYFHPSHSPAVSQDNLFTSSVSLNALSESKPDDTRKYEVNASSQQTVASTHVLPNEFEIFLVTTRRDLCTVRQMVLIIAR